MLLRKYLSSTVLLCNNTAYLFHPSSPQLQFNPQTQGVPYPLHLTAICKLLSFASCFLHVSCFLWPSAKVILFSLATAPLHEPQSTMSSPVNSLRVSKQPEDVSDSIHPEAVNCKRTFYACYQIHCFHLHLNLHIICQYVIVEAHSSFHVEWG